MEQEATKLARFLIEQLSNIQPSARLLVGIAGIPASGKSTFAQLLTICTNELLESGEIEKSCRAILVGLDGWHLSRAQLDALPDPKLAYDRRGAHWTFDGHAYVSFIRMLRAELTDANQVITAPSFDHALKDPTIDDISIYPNHRIIIIEGLYTFLSIEPWNEAGILLNERWLIQVDIDEAQRRLVGRHVVSGVARDLEEAVWRAEQNDMPNGRFILANMLEPTRIIQSINDPSLALL